MTIDTSQLVNLETLIQQWLESAGLPCLGPEILDKIKLLPKHHTIDITLTVSCVRNLDTDQITEVSLTLSPHSQNFLLKL